MGVFRLFLSLSVLLGHAHGHGFLGLSFLNAALAVQSFFIISGFYMALILNEKYNQPGQYMVFLKQRFLRLYPTYFILVAAVLLIELVIFGITGRAWGAVKDWGDYFHFFSPLKITCLVVENIIIFGQNLLFFVTIDPASGAFHFVPLKWPVGVIFLVIPTSWSLALEFCFYVLAPFLVCRSWRIQIAIFIFCGLFRLAIAWLSPIDPGSLNYFLFAPNLFFFMAGSLGYILYKNYEARLRAIALSQPWILFIFALLGLDFARYPHSNQLSSIWLLLVFIMVPMLFALTRRSRIDRIIGELSYPCYLIHPFVLTFTIPFLSMKHWQGITGPVDFAATLGLSYLFYRFVELKIEHFRERLYQKSLKSSG